MSASFAGFNFLQNFHLNWRLTELAPTQYPYIVAIILSSEAVEVPFPSKSLRFDITFKMTKENSNAFKRVTIEMFELNVCCRNYQEFHELKNSKTSWSTDHSF